MLAMVLKRKSKEPVKPESKEQVYAQLDPTLGILHKEWKVAMQQYTNLSKENGPDDEMLDVAIDRLDAARLSFETRLLEVKADKALFVKAEKLWEQEQQAVQKGAASGSQGQNEPQMRLKDFEQAWYAFALEHGFDLTQNRDSNFGFYLFLLIAGLSDSHQSLADMNMSVGMGLTLMPDLQPEYRA